MACLTRGGQVLAEKKIILAAQSEEQLENHQQLLRHVSSTYKERWSVYSVLLLLNWLVAVGN